MVRATDGMVPLGRWLPFALADVVTCLMASSGVRLSVPDVMRTWGFEIPAQTTRDEMTDDDWLRLADGQK